MSLCTYKQFICWVTDVSFPVLANGKKSLWAQWKHVTDTILAVPRFSQHVFLASKSILYPVLQQYIHDSFIAQAKKTCSTITSGPHREWKGRERKFQNRSDNRMNGLSWAETAPALLCNVSVRLSVYLIDRTTNTVVTVLFWYLFYFENWLNWMSVLFCVWLPVGDNLLCSV